MRFQIDLVNYSLILFALVEVLLALPLQQGILGLSNIPVSSSNNGITLYKQNQPQYQLLQNANQLPIVLSTVQSPAGLGGNYQGIPSGTQPTISEISANEFRPSPGTLLYAEENLGNRIPNVVSVNPLVHAIQPVNDRNLLSSLYSSPNNPIVGTVVSNPTQYPLIATGDYNQFTTPHHIQRVPTILLPLSSVSSSYSLPDNYPNRGVTAILSVPNIGLLESYLNKGSSIGPGSITLVKDVGAPVQKPGLQGQVVQLPCTLSIPSPVPVTVNPGNTQILTNIPPQQSSVPSSFIDNSPPTIAILRPPSSQGSVMVSSDNLPVAAPNLVSSSQMDDSMSNTHFIIEPKTLTTSKLATTINERTKQNARSQDSQGAPNQNNDTESGLVAEADHLPGVARSSLPVMYAVVPPSLLSYSTAATPAVETLSGKTKSSQVPSSQNSRGKNPFFNVNKRKHFEFYQYF